MIDFDDNNDWATIDRFVSEWLRTQFTRDPLSPEVDELECSVGVSLPSAVREWCAFALAARTLTHFSWRDCLIVEPVPGHEAVSLLLQGEADYYWAIENQNLTHSNPPVIGYSLDYDSEESTFQRAGTWAPSVTAFALDYFLSYLQSPGGGFGVRQSSEYFEREKLLADFGQPTRFGHLELFHSDGVLVVLGGLPPNWRHNVINVEIQTKRPFNKLPQSVQRLVKDATVFHGGLDKYR